MKIKFSAFLLLCSFSFFAQNIDQSSFNTKLSACADSKTIDFESCVDNSIQNFIIDNFKSLTDIVHDNEKFKIIVIYTVNNEGGIEITYIDAPKEELVNEMKRVFSLFPKVSLNKSNFKNVITFQYAFITSDNAKLSIFKPLNLNQNIDLQLEYDQIVNKKFSNPKFKSVLNIPFSHSYYSYFDAYMNTIGINNHTASKPYSYAEVSKYFDFEKTNSDLMLKKEGWWGRKLFNDNLVQIQGADYWFTLNPVLDLQLGKNTASNYNYTYINSRAIQLQGGLGHQLTFSASIFENQGRFADYFNQYAISIKPDGGNPAIIPGIGIAKEFKTDAFDFPLAEANIKFSANKFINLEFGYGRNFIGDGYRSLLFSDGASPYPFFKINTTFWKIKYTNNYMWMKDVRSEAVVDKTYASKFVANHFLSLNVTKKLNLGFFESVIWSNSNGRGFDMSFANPIIFYRSVEFVSSSRTGNALLGFTAKYKLSNTFNFYSQFLLDEFSLSDVKAQNKSWKNKFGYQIGVKKYNIFNIKNLNFQLEYNRVRPYVYSHLNALTNYGHNNQSLGHQWGGNFQELIAIARYHKGRFFVDSKLTIGKRGLDFNTTTDNYNYGSNIYLGYNDNRPFDKDVVVGQGNTTKVFIADFQSGYLLNPNTNLKVFGSVIYRSFNPIQNTASLFSQSTTWFSVGLRSDVFNWYFDY